MMKKYQFALAIGLLVTLAACAQTLTGAVSHTNTFQIGGAFSLTGDAAEWGNDELKASQLAIDEFNAADGTNGLLVELVVEDTKTDSTGTLNSVQKLIQVDQVPAIIGPTWGDSFGSIIGPIGEETKTVQLTPSGAIEVAEGTVDYPYFFSTFFPLKSEFAAHLTLMKKRNYTKIVLIHDVDPFNTLWTNLYAEEAKALGINVAENYEIQLGDNDFKTILTKAKEHKPDAVVVTIFEIGKVGLILKTMQELGMNAVVFGSASAQTQALIDEYGTYSEGKVFTSSPALTSEQYNNFIATFAQKYGTAPTGATAANAYDATRAVLETLKQGARSGEEIRAKLNELNMPGTFAETINFDEKGQVGNVPFEMNTVKDGRFVKVEN